MHCKPCEICPVANVCIQSVTNQKCPIENYEHPTPKPKNNKKENK